MEIIQKLTALKETAIRTLDAFIMDLATSSDPALQKKSGLLSYWIADYISMLKKEHNSKKYRCYKRGEIIKVHFGYRIGHEEGGLHYAVVVSVCDSPYSGIVTVVPLTSLKNTERIKRLRRDEVFLGSQLLQKLYNKIQQTPNRQLANEIVKLKWGSIALVGQITTISKLRIMDPISASSPLAGVKLDREAMCAIDNCIKDNFIYS